MFPVFLGLTMTQMEALAADTDPNANPLYSCLEPDNFALLAAAIIDAQAGGRAEATRSCIQEVVREHPGAMYARLGVEPPTGVNSLDATATHSVGLEIFDCLGAEEQLAYALRIWSTETGVSTLTGQDLADVLDAEDETCLRDKHGAGYDTLLTTTLPDHPAAAEFLGECRPEQPAAAFATVLSGVAGGLSDASRSCLEAVGTEHPHIVDIVHTGEFDDSGTSAEEMAHLVGDVRLIWDCYTVEELERVQSVFVDQLAG